MDVLEMVFLAQPHVLFGASFFLCGLMCNVLIAYKTVTSTLQ